MRATLLGVALVTMGTSLLAPTHRAGAQPTLPALIVTGVAADTSSAKIEFKPVLGAQDYRVFDRAAPTLMKYAGLRVWRVAPHCSCHVAVGDDGTTPLYPFHTVPNTPDQNGPTQVYGPNTEIEWNLLEDGEPHTLVVQAVDALGPVPPDNAARLTRHGITRMGLMDHTAMMGSNSGSTPDGKTSINGQGPATNVPHVIAQSAPFVVQARPSFLPIPSRPDAAQTFLDTFEDDEGSRIIPLPADPGRPDTASYLVDGGTPLASTIAIQTDITDTAAASVMIVDGHMMDIVPSGGTSGLHMTMTPAKLVRLVGGRILHITMEVDAVTFGNRWLELGLNSALPGNYNAVTVRFTEDQLDISQAYEIHRPGATPTMTETTLTTTRRNVDWGGNGRAIDDRSRFDLFLGEHRVAVFEDGHLLTDSTLPGPLGMSVAQVQYRHFFYHSDLAASLLNNGVAAERLEREKTLYWRPWDPAQIVAYPFSDERHWDNMGFEVLPPSAVPVHWAHLAELIHMPQWESPHIVVANK
jgi:hypothetical protein